MGGGARTRVRGRPSHISSEVCVKVQKEPACRCVVGAGSRLGGLARPFSFPPPLLTRAPSPLLSFAWQLLPVCPTHLCVRARPWVAPVLGSGRAGARPGTPERVRETHTGRPPAEGERTSEGRASESRRAAARRRPLLSLPSCRAHPPLRATPLSPPLTHPHPRASSEAGRVCVRSRQREASDLRSAPARARPPHAAPPRGPPPRWRSPPERLASSATYRQKKKNVAAMFAIQWLWISSMVIAHLLGAYLLLYAIEKVNGGVSRTVRRLLRRPAAAATPRTPKTAGAGPFVEARPTGAALAASRRAASSSMLYADDSMAGDPYKAPETTLAPAWVRGCKCQVRRGGRAIERRGEERERLVTPPLRGAGGVACPHLAAPRPRPGACPPRGLALGGGPRGRPPGRGAPHWRLGREGAPARPRARSASRARASFPQRPGGGLGGAPASIWAPDPLIVWTV